MSQTLDRKRTTDDWMAELGVMLRARRIRAGLTQLDLARQAGVGSSTLKHLEAGTGATLSTLIKVVRALGAEQWLSALALPSEPTVSPMQLLRQQQRTPTAQRRVRRTTR